MVVSIQCAMAIAAKTITNGGSGFNHKGGYVPSAPPSMSAPIRPELSILVAAFST